jgi:hypothetical protein
MKESFTVLVNKYLPEFPKEVSLKLPKLQKVGKGNGLPKLKLPKLKKVEVQDESRVTV